MKNLQNRGFTLIELLVVIAIIGILSSVVLASLSTARTRGQIAAVQADLSGMRAQAELYAQSNSNQYATAAVTSCTAATSVFSGTNSLATLITGATSKGATLTCYASTTGWTVGAAIGGTYMCVDGNGKSTSSSTATAITQIQTQGAGCL